MSPADANGQYVLYIHGGGFSSGSAKERRDITTYIASEYGFTVYANDYRLAPQVGLPEMQEDCLNFYLGILESGANGKIEIKKPLSKAGDKIVLTALVDCVFDNKMKVLMINGN